MLRGLSALRAPPLPQRAYNERWYLGRPHRQRYRQLWHKRRRSGHLTLGGGQLRRQRRVGYMHGCLDMVAVTFGTRTTFRNKEWIVVRRGYFALMPQTTTRLSHSSPCSAPGMAAPSASMAPSQPQVTLFSSLARRLITFTSKPIASHRFQQR